MSNEQFVKSQLRECASSLKTAFQIIGISFDSLTKQISAIQSNLDRFNNLVDGFDSNHLLHNDHIGQINLNNNNVGAKSLSPRTAESRMLSNTDSNRLRALSVPANNAKIVINDDNELDMRQLITQYAKYNKLKRKHSNSGSEYSESQQDNKNENNNNNNNNKKNNVRMGNDLTMDDENEIEKVIATLTNDENEFKEDEIDLKGYLTPDSNRVTERIESNIDEWNVLANKAIELEEEDFDKLLNEVTLITNKSNTDHEDDDSDNDHNSENNDATTDNDNGNENKNESKKLKARKAEKKQIESVAKNNNINNNNNSNNKHKIQSVLENENELNEILDKIVNENDCNWILAMIKFDKNNKGYESNVDQTHVTKGGPSSPSNKMGEITDYETENENNNNNSNKNNENENENDDSKCKEILCTMIQNLKYLYNSNSFKQKIVKDIRIKYHFQGFVSSNNDTYYLLIYDNSGNGSSFIDKAISKLQFGFAMKTKRIKHDSTISVGLSKLQNNETKKEWQQRVETNLNFAQTHGDGNEYAWDNQQLGTMKVKKPNMNHGNSFKNKSNFNKFKQNKLNKKKQLQNNENKNEDNDNDANMMEPGSGVKPITNDSEDDDDDDNGKELKKGSGHKKQKLKVKKDGKAQLQMKPSENDADDETDNELNDNDNDNEIENDEKIPCVSLFEPLTLNSWLKNDNLVNFVKSKLITDTMNEITLLDYLYENNVSSDEFKCDIIDKLNDDDNNSELKKEFINAIDKLKKENKCKPSKLNEYKEYLKNFDETKPELIIEALKQDAEPQLVNGKDYLLIDDATKVLHSLEPNTKHTFEYGIYLLTRTMLCAQKRYNINNKDNDENNMAWIEIECGHLYIKNGARVTSSRMIEGKTHGNGIKNGDKAGNLIINVVGCLYNEGSITAGGSYGIEPLTEDEKYELNFNGNALGGEAKAQGTKGANIIVNLKNDSFKHKIGDIHSSGGWDSRGNQQAKSGNVKIISKNKDCIVLDNDNLYQADIQFEYTG